MENTKPEIQILTEAVSKYGRLKASQVRQIAKDQCIDENELLRCYLEHFYDKKLKV